MEDNLEGPAVYVFADGSRMEVMFQGGSMTGSAQEYDPDGMLTFQGQYRDNIKCGMCWYYKQVRIFHNGNVLLGFFLVSIYFTSFGEQYVRSFRHTYTHMHTCTHTHTHTHTP